MDDFLSVGVLGASDIQKEVDWSGSYNSGVPE
jgi:hypothetical protein